MTEPCPDPPQRLDEPTTGLGVLAAAVQDCPAVAGLHPGARNAIATRTSQGWLAGLVCHDHILVVGVVGYPAYTTSQITEQVRAAVAIHAADLYVLVTTIDAGRRGSARSARR